MEKICIIKTVDKDTRQITLKEGSNIKKEEKVSVNNISDFISKLSGYKLIIK